MACCFSGNEEQKAATVKQEKYPILASRGWSASNLLPHYLFLFVLTVLGDEPETALNATHRLSPLRWKQWRNYFLVLRISSKAGLVLARMYVHLDLGPALVEFACSPRVAFLLVLQLPFPILVIWTQLQVWIQMSFCFNKWSLRCTADLRCI